MSAPSGIAGPSKRPDYSLDEVKGVRASSSDMAEQNSPIEIKSGTAQDEADMYRLGKKQQLNRGFQSVAILGLTCLITATWEAMLAVTTFSLVNGGFAGSVYTYLVVWALSVPVTASLAEMQSMAPSSGGQYHWVSEFAPASIQKQLSYISGWLSALGWQAFVANGCYQSAYVILILVNTTQPDYVPTAWQGMLMTFAVGIFCLVFNIFLAKRLPILDGILLFCHIIGFFAICVPLWVLAPKAPATQVFTSFSNYGGWASVGSACVIGSLAANSAMIGQDAAAHMSEEVRNASLTVPRMMMLALLINGVLGFITLLTFLFSIQDISEQVIQSTAVYPWIPIIAKATGSVWAALGMAMPIMVVNFGTLINCMAAGSRQAWSFARDGGMIFPEWFTRIREVDGVPLPFNATLATTFLAAIFALVSLGATQVFNSTTALFNGAIGLTYTVSIGSVLWRRICKPETLPQARWSLGIWGIPCNLIAVLYMALSVVVGFFPLYKNTTVQAMNYGVVMFAGVAALAFVYYWIHGRKLYSGPVVDIRKVPR